MNRERFGEQEPPERAVRGQEFGVRRFPGGDSDLAVIFPQQLALLLAGRERPFWTYYARRQMWDPSALTEEDIDEIVHSAEQPGGTRAILEMYRAHQTDAEQNRPHYADPIT